MKLRPVTFRYRNDQNGTRQYGLVAEEVERVYPELVTYSVDGQVQRVRYSMLRSMPLNEQLWECAPRPGRTSDESSN